ncbi:MAG: hypothetical protein ACKVJG_27910 [Candidatus Latescibacterota bacterium]
MELAARARRKEMVEFLLERGADPTTAGAECATPLAWTQKGGWTEVAALLEERSEGDGWHFLHA